MGSDFKDKVTDLKSRMDADPALRKQVLDSPLKAIEKECGVTLPDVDDEQLRAKYPRFFQIEEVDADLTDKELDHVAGGKACHFHGCACLCQ